MYPFVVQVAGRTFVQFFTRGGAERYADVERFSADGDVVVSEVAATPKPAAQRWVTYSCVATYSASPHFSQYIAAPFYYPGGS